MLDNLEIVPVRAGDVQSGDVLVSMRPVGAPRFCLVTAVWPDLDNDRVTLEVLDSVAGELADGGFNEAAFKCDLIDVFGKVVQ